MGDSLFERKFNEMQKYIPFLERVIEKLKNNDHDKPRKAQLEKMQMLHNLLTNKQKKLKVDTLLKCEIVLKKLHAKIEKSDELKPSKPSTTAPKPSSVAPKKIQATPSKSLHATSPSFAAKFVPNSNCVVEVNTCPASPTQFGDEDFRPPLEIPMERRCSPTRGGPTKHWEQHNSNKQHQTEHAKQHSRTGSPRFQNRSSDYRSDYQSSNNKYHQLQQTPPDRTRSSHSRWSDPRDWKPETPPVMPSSNHHRSWSSSSSSASSNTYRSHGQQKNEPRKVYSSEEENWDDPEDEPVPPKSTPKLPPLPKSTPKQQPPPPPLPSSSSHRESNNSPHQRHHEKSKKQNRDYSSQSPQSYSPSPDTCPDNDSYQKKIYHDTIYKYRKPDPPKLSFQNPMRTESPSSTPPHSNIFNRLGDKLDNNYENFRIEVKNDKMKSKPPKLAVPSLVIIKRIDEVLKSPPLSADDIDDLLNESLEASVGKSNKPNSVEQVRERTASPLDIVRKKLAKISKPKSPPPPQSNNSQDDQDPFYRRGNTPQMKAPQSSHMEQFKPPIVSHKNYASMSPPNPIDPGIERLALKYNPHRRRDSITNMPQDKEDTPTIRGHNIDPMTAATDRLALKYHPHLRRDSMGSPLRTADPRVGKMLGQISPVSVSPVPNVLSGINVFDPRLRNTRPANMDPIAPGSFCTAIPYASPIPSHMDKNIMNHLPHIGGPLQKPPFGATAPSRLDPRTHKLSTTIYADKFNPERNDQTERMKYLESKKKKLPEPKTYGEYKQSKSRQQAEEAAKAGPMITIDQPPIVPSLLLPIPSTLDKMYRNAEYGKEIGGSIQRFKIPKKTKADEQKVEPKKSEESVNKLEKSEESEESQTSLNKRSESMEKLDETNDASTNKSVEVIEIDSETSQGTESVSDSPNDSAKSIGDLVIVKVEGPPEPEPIVLRRRGRPRTVKKEVNSPQVNKNDDTPLQPPQLEKESQEYEEDDLKSRRILTRRSTIVKDELKETTTPTPPQLARCRSASDIFAPTTDNSVVSTQNIISGKRKTRASVNFNEKAVKKPTTPPKATPNASPANTLKIAGKPGPKTIANKSTTPRTRKQASAGDKKAFDDGQICAVSSTTSQGGDIDESQTNDSMDTEEVGSTEEPSSSGSKPQTPLVDADENQKKQEWLEGFLTSIVDPSANKDAIIDMLKAVLDDKKLQQIKDILYSPEDEDREAPMSAKKTHEQSKPRGTRTKKNELDRLNDDIRDMFICEGVVTATGRRMCTLAKETSKETTAAKQKDQSKERKTVRKESQSPVNALGKGRMRRAKVLISPLNMRALRSRYRKGSRPPEMPVLEPNTPIKLPGEDDDEEEVDVQLHDKEDVVQLRKKKPGPKSKRRPTFDLDFDEDCDDVKKDQSKQQATADKEDDNFRAQVKKEEKVAEVKEMEVQNEPELTTAMVEKKEKDKVEEKVEAKPEDIPKNTNPDWHTMSKYATCCVICKKKTRYIAPHYINSHMDSEVYISRLPPGILEGIKHGIGNRALYSISKKPNLIAFNYRCPFCDFQVTSTLRCWIEHFTIHTGEYQYKCSGCFKAMNGCTHLVEHIKKSCPSATKINRETVNLKGNSISGFVCHLCNFVQMLRSGVVRHLKLHHDLDDEASIARIIEVKLVDTVGVPKMDEKAVVPANGLAPPSNLLKDTSTSNESSNMEVFLSSELASPTPDGFTERLKSINRENETTSEDTSSDTARITIVDRLSQRFEELQKLKKVGGVKDVRSENLSNPTQNEKEEPKDTEKTTSTPMDVDASTPASTPADDNAVQLPVTSPVPDSFNDSGKLVIDEQEGDKSADDGSDSECADGNDEDDNENWEDIEITESKTSSQKEKGKNKSIFKTLSRLYASIAPKKSSKKSKDKEKKKVDSPPEGETAQPIANPPLPPIEKPALPPKENLPLPPYEDPPLPRNDDPPLPPRLPADQAPAPLPVPLPIPPQISNLSDLLPDSPSDSLDMLLATNFNCLEGDGTSFPHLDLNDLDSPIFLLSEEQSNLQDAIAMATDLDQAKYDVLGDPLPPPLMQPPIQPQVSTAAGVHRIGNFGFSLSGDTLKYYCMVTACTFLFSDHPDGLQNHFLMEHSALRWNGYCHTCEAHVCSEGGREMQHMLDIHSKGKLEDQSGDKPRIKFRRLTGDILSTGNEQLPGLPSLIGSLQPPDIPPVRPVIKEPPVFKKADLCLSSLLQSEPRAMIQPTPPPTFETDIPLYKNISKEFTITGVAEGVTDDDLRNLVLNQAESTPGGMQISQVISLNAGGKCVSPAPLSLDFPQITDLISSFEHRSSPSLLDLHATLQFPESLSQRNSPTTIQINLPFTGSLPPLDQCHNTAASQQSSSSPVPPANTLPKQHAFKCCAKQCPYSTNIRSAMNEHLVFHMRTDNDRGSLKCHECGFVGRNITDYFQHMAQGHSSTASTPPCPPTTNELTQKIQDILRATTNPGKSLDGEKDSHKPETANTFAERLRKVAEEAVTETGLTDKEVWKCPLFPECTRSVTEKDFLTHVGKHISCSYPSRPPGAPLHCPHCTVNYHRPAILKAHIKTHARHQYFCHVCCGTSANFQQAQKHFNENHGRSSNVSTQCLIPDEDPDTPPFYVVSGDKLTVMQIIQFGEKLLADWERKKALTKTHFQPHEQYLLPLQPIFNNQVCCSVCNYKTKVRTNMYRHLQLHMQDIDVASVDPVNPVPCLEKNEKHFDKMLNLACSSNATGSAAKSKESTGPTKIPIFVPDLRRFVCGHPGCTYLTITDQMLRSHLNALHCGEKGYQCPHCQEEICKKTMCAEKIVQHLKFHGQKIYQCSECEYMHYTRHIVDRHAHEKHTGIQFVNLIMYDRTEGEVKKTSQLVIGRVTPPNLVPPTSTEVEQAPEQPSTSFGPPSKCKWECALCKHQTVTWNQMISHTNSVHQAKHQYLCVHCTYGSAQLPHIMEHIDSKHPSKTREVKYVFYKINETQKDKAADTRPLWSRDDPKRVRSIRGILMENEDEAERTQQIINNACVDMDDDDDDAEELIQVTESESALKPGILGCFHCDFKTEDISNLTIHWRSKHWYLKNNQVLPKLPFFFRVHSILKCPSCPYVGDYVSMQLHAFNKHAQRAFCAADPLLPNTCGHCPFVFPPKRLEVLTRHYHREHKPTDVKNLSSNFLKSVLSLGECQAYMQCYICAEICADKMAIIVHQRERHGCSNVRYKQIKGEVIYRCGMCHYSSTNEMATLRHMIDHFGGFIHCYFCMASQENFNAYMQHCYVTHPKELMNFKQIYTLQEMSTFLGQMLVIFPNGLIVTKRNLVHTQYGSCQQINAMYDEICKKALEPPIPPLCMARLMARKYTETKETTPLLPPPPVPVTAKRIAKRRSTVAISLGDNRLSDFLVPSGLQNIKRRKASISDDRPVQPLFSTITATMSEEEKTTAFQATSNPANVQNDTIGVSFYGKVREPIDLSKIYTQIAIGDKYAPVSVKKFALLFKMNAKVEVEKMDLSKYQLQKRTQIVSKPCPASKKKRMA